MRRISTASPNWRSWRSTTPGRARCSPTSSPPPRRAARRLPEPRGAAGRLRRLPPRGRARRSFLRVGVDPEARRQGLARALLTEGLERLRRLDVQVCFLEVRVDNKPAIDLYESLGFSCTGHRKGYYRDGTDALIFVLGI